MTLAASHRSARLASWKKSEVFDSTGDRLSAATQVASRIDAAAREPRCNDPEGIDLELHEVGALAHFDALTPTWHPAGARGVHRCHTYGVGETDTRHSHHVLDGTIHAQRAARE